MKLFSRELASRGSGWASLLYWALLSACTFLIVRPLWIGALPPLSDFGGHLAMADIWIRLDQVDLYSNLFVRQQGWVPNLLAARFAGWMDPLLDPLASLRLFVTLALVGNVLALVYALHVFQRSRWVVFACLPLLWNGMLGLGMINYVGAIPLMILAIALARRAGHRGHWLYGIGLAAVTLLAFLMHGVGYVYTVSMAAFVLVLSVKRAARLLHVAAFFPSIVLFARWFEGSAPLADLNGTGLADLVWDRIRSLPSTDNIHWLLREACDITTSDVDTNVFAVVTAIWVVFMGISVAGTRMRQPAESLSTEASASPSRKRLMWRIGGGARRLGRELNQHALLLLALCMGIAAYVLPPDIHQIAINYRLVTPLLLTLMLLPHLPSRSTLAGAMIALAIGTSSWYGLYLADRMEEFDRIELQPLVHLLDSLPDQQMVACFGVDGAHAGFIWRPLLHNCSGLVHARTQSVVDGGFANTWFNAVRFRQGRSVPGYNARWFDNVLSDRWDYVIVRGSHRMPNSTLMRLVERVEPVDSEDFESAEWRLYEVHHFDRRPTTSTERAGGSGGVPFAWHCPPNHLLVGFDGWLSPNGGIVASLQPKCRRVESDGAEVRPTGRMISGPQIGLGQGEQRVRSHCTGGLVMIGAYGRSGIYVDRIGAMCAEAASWVADSGYGDREVAQSTRAQVLGGEGGAEFDLRCPQGQVAVGLSGRYGSLIDAIGLSCIDITALLDNPPDTPP